MQEIIFGMITVGFSVISLGYIFFWKPKSKIEKKSVLFNADVNWGGTDAEEVFETLGKLNSKPTFK